MPSWMSPVSSAFSNQSGVPMSRLSSTSLSRAKKRRIASATGSSGFIASLSTRPIRSRPVSARRSSPRRASQSSTPDSISLARA